MRAPSDLSPANTTIVVVVSRRCFKVALLVLLAAVAVVGVVPCGSALAAEKQQRYRQF